MDIVYGLFAGNHLCQHTVSLSLLLVYVDPLVGGYREFFCLYCRVPGEGEYRAFNR